MKKKIYLDYAATTPVDQRVVKAMLPYFSKKFGNTMSLHSFGQEAKEILEESRAIMANLIKAKPEEIIFTSSATESNNLVLKGIALANSGRGRHLIISSIEHPCIMESTRFLESQGFEITRLKVDGFGLVNPEDVKKAIRRDTILVSVMHANNEIGTIQPIQEIGEIIKKSNIKNLKPAPYRADLPRSDAKHLLRGGSGSGSKIYFHTDAVQTFGKIEIDVNKMNIDLLSASSHKMYGPKGAALLYIKEGTKITPLLHGGGHESGLRSSTINVGAIVGFAEAVKICRKEIYPVKSAKGGAKQFNRVEKEAGRLTKLRDKLIKGVLEKIKGSHLNGHPQKRLLNNVNFWFEGIEGESLVMQLDLLGIAASTGSACSSEKLEPSHVLLAIGLRHEQAHGSLRLSLGRWTTQNDVDYVLKVLPEVITKLRKISPFKKKWE